MYIERQSFSDLLQHDRSKLHNAMFLVEGAVLFCTETRQEDAEYDEDSDEYVVGLISAYFKKYNPDRNSWDPVGWINGEPLERIVNTPPPACLFKKRLHKHGVYGAFRRVQGYSSFVSSDSVALFAPVFYGHNNKMVWEQAYPPSRAAAIARAMLDLPGSEYAGHIVAGHNPYGIIKNGLLVTGCLHARIIGYSDLGVVAADPNALGTVVYFGRNNSSNRTELIAPDADSGRLSYSKAQLDLYKHASSLFDTTE